MQLSLFKPHEIMTDKLRKVVDKVRASLKPFPSTNNVIYLSYNKRRLFRCSNVRKIHGNN